MTIHSLRSYLAHRPTVLAIIIALLPAMNDTAQARILIGVQSNSSSSSSSGAAPTTGLNTQTATAATAAAAQAARAAVISKRAQDSLVSSTRAFQNAMSAQALANQNSTANLLDSNNNPINGLAAGGLVPVGGVPATTSSSAIQVVDLSGSGKNQLVLSNGGSVTLPAGTAGNDSVTIPGAGSVTTTGGSVTTSGGSVTTTTGGTLTANNGGIISFTAGSGTLSASTAATITSSPGRHSDATLGRRHGSAYGQRGHDRAGGEHGLVHRQRHGDRGGERRGNGEAFRRGHPASGTGGTITTSSGTTNFTNATISSEPLGTTISLNGSGAISFTGSGSDVLPGHRPANHGHLDAAGFLDNGLSPHHHGIRRAIVHHGRSILMDRGRRAFGIGQRQHRAGHRYHHAGCVAGFALLVFVQHRQKHDTRL